METGSLRGKAGSLQAVTCPRRPTCRGSSCRRSHLSRAWCWSRTIEWSSWPQASEENEREEKEKEKEKDKEERRGEEIKEKFKDKEGEREEKTKKKKRE